MSKSVSALMSGLVFASLLQACAREVDDSRAKPPKAIFTVNGIRALEETACGLSAPANAVRGGELPRHGMTGCADLDASSVDAHYVSSVDLLSVYPPQVVLRISEEGVRRLNDLASRASGEPVALTAQGKVVSTPLVESAGYAEELVLFGLTLEEAILFLNAFEARAERPDEYRKVLSSYKQTRDARETCAARRPATVPADAIVSGEELSAGDVVELSRRFDKPASPWDAVSPDQTVFRCSYWAAAPLRNCGPAERAVLGHAGNFLATRFFLDEDGRSSRDMTPTSTRLRPECLPAR